MTQWWRENGGVDKREGRGWLMVGCDLVDKCVGVERGRKRKAEAQVLWLGGRVEAGRCRGGEEREVGEYGRLGGGDGKGEAQLGLLECLRWGTEIKVESEMGAILQDCFCC